MITINFPHMGLNDERAPVFVQMWNTWNVTQTEKKQRIVDWTASVARSAPGGKLASIVICCHGAPGYLALGEGIAIGDVGLFEAWRGLVDKVWIRACLVARIVTPDTLKILPVGKLDTYEGLVLSYGPDGTITWSKRYPSVRNADPKTMTAGNPNRE